MWTLPLVEEGEQRFELEDRNTIQMNYMSTFVFGPFIVVGVAAAGLLSKYLSEHGGVS